MLIEEFDACVESGDSVKIEAAVKVFEKADGYLATENDTELRDCVSCALESTRLSVEQRSRMLVALSRGISLEFERSVFENPPIFDYWFMDLPELINRELENLSTNSVSYFYEKILLPSILSAKNLGWLESENVNQLVDLSLRIRQSCG